jgi:hypothetical protein
MGLTELDGERLDTFLVERYWPGVEEESMRVGEVRLRSVVARLEREGNPVRYLRSLIVPADGVVFSLFVGRSAVDVAEANRQAEVPFDRIVRAIEIGPPDPAASGRERRSS